MKTEDFVPSGCVQEKIVVCITPQSNSKRLIDKGTQIARECNGQLHILHVQKGDNIFHNQETLKWLQHLFVYGNAVGGMVHALCDDHIAKCISRFVVEEGITKVVLGELPKHVRKQNKKQQNHLCEILENLPENVSVSIVKRDDDNIKDLDLGCNGATGYSIA